MGYLKHKHIRIDEYRWELVLLKDKSIDDVDQVHFDVYQYCITYDSVNPGKYGDIEIESFGETQKGDVKISDYKVTNKFKKNQIFSFFIRVFTIRNKQVGALCTDS